MSTLAFQWSALALSVDGNFPINSSNFRLECEREFHTSMCDGAVGWSMDLDSRDPCTDYQIYPYPHARDCLADVLANPPRPVLPSFHTYIE